MDALTPLEQYKTRQLTILKVCKIRTAMTNSLNTLAGDALLLIMLLAILGVSASVSRTEDKPFKPLPTIKIDDPQEIAEVEALQKTYSQYSAKGRECMKAGGASVACQCKPTPERDSRLDQRCVP